MRFFHRKQKQRAQLSRKELEVAIQQELGGYLKREDLQDYLDKIKRDERRRQLWDSMSSRKKIKVLRYVLEKKGGGYGKK